MPQVSKFDLYFATLIVVVTLLYTHFSNPRNATSNDNDSNNNDNIHNRTKTKPRTTTPLPSTSPKEYLLASELPPTDERCHYLDNALYDPFSPACLRDQMPSLPEYLVPPQDLPRKEAVRLQRWVTPREPDAPLVPPTYSPTEPQLDDAHRRLDGATEEESLNDNDKPSMEPSIMETLSSAPSYATTEETLYEPSVEPSSSAPSYTTTDQTQDKPSVEPSTLETIDSSSVPFYATTEEVPDKPSVEPSTSDTVSSSSAPSYITTTTPAPKTMTTSTTTSGNSRLSDDDPAKTGSVEPSFVDDTFVPTYMTTDSQAPSSLPSLDDDPTKTLFMEPSSIDLDDTFAPTYMNTMANSDRNSQVPSSSPSSGDDTTKPSMEPSLSMDDTFAPTYMTTNSDSNSNSQVPSSLTSSSVPTIEPSTNPSNLPTDFATNALPSEFPSAAPTGVSIVPTVPPTELATSVSPSSSPSEHPTTMDQHELLRFLAATEAPTTDSPTVLPTEYPSEIPSSQPSSGPTDSLAPTQKPSMVPSLFPTTSAAPSIAPPTIAPSANTCPIFLCDFSNLDIGILLSEVHQHDMLEEACGFEISGLAADGTSYFGVNVLDSEHAKQTELGSPHVSCGGPPTFNGPGGNVTGPYPNCNVTQGPVLVLQEPGVPEKRPQSSTSGGCFMLDFIDPVDMENIGILNIRHGEMIKIHMENGDGESEYITSRADMSENSLWQVNMTHPSVKQHGTTKIEICLPSTGALAFIAFHDDCGPSGTRTPTELPIETESPTEGPTVLPTEGPTLLPTEGPTEGPTMLPTESPTTEAPTAEDRRYLQTSSNFVHCDFDALEPGVFVSEIEQHDLLEDLCYVKVTGSLQNTRGSRAVIAGWSTIANYSASNDTTLCDDQGDDGIVCSSQDKTLTMGGDGKEDQGGCINFDFIDPVRLEGIGLTELPQQESVQITIMTQAGTMVYMQSPNAMGFNELWHVNETDPGLRRRAVILVSVCTPSSVAVSYLDYVVDTHETANDIELTTQSWNEESSTDSAEASESFPWCGRHLSGFALHDANENYALPGFDMLEDGQKLVVSNLPPNFVVSANVDEMVGFVKFYFPFKDTTTSSPFHLGSDWLHDLQGTVQIRADAFTIHEKLLGSCEVNVVVDSSRVLSCGSGVGGFFFADSEGERIERFGDLRNGQAFLLNDLLEARVDSIVPSIHQSHVAAVKYEGNDFQDVYHADSPFRLSTSSFMSRGKYSIKAHGYVDTEFSSLVNSCEITFEVIEQVEHHGIVNASLPNLEIADDEEETEALEQSTETPESATKKQERHLKNEIINEESLDKLLQEESLELWKEWTEPLDTPTNSPASSPSPSFEIVDNTAKQQQEEKDPILDSQTWCGSHLSQFSIVDGTDTPVPGFGPLFDHQIVRMSDLPKDFAILPSVDEHVVSIKYHLPSGQELVAAQAPFLLDTGFLYQQQGTIKIRADAYATVENEGMGAELLGSCDIVFEVEHSSNIKCGPGVTGFFLVGRDGTKIQKYGTLQDGQVIQGRNLPYGTDIGVEHSPKLVGSVRFEADGLKESYSYEEIPFFRMQTNNLHIPRTYTIHAHAYGKDFSTHVNSCEITIYIL